MEIMTTPDLKAFVKNEKSKGLDNTKKYEIETYKRTAGPFTILILTLIGASIGTKKVRGGLGMHLAIGVVLGAVYVVLSKFSETFASNLQLPSLIGVWTPNILFSIVSIVLYNKAQK
jgi:lipopolysaccharide export system permease protein